MKATFPLSWRRENAGDRSDLKFCSTPLCPFRILYDKWCCRAKYVDLFRAQREKMWRFVLSANSTSVLLCWQNAGENFHPLLTSDVPIFAIVFVNSSSRLYSWPSNLFLSLVHTGLNNCQLQDSASQFTFCLYTSVSVIRSKQFSEGRRTEVLKNLPFFCINGFPSRTCSHRSLFVLSLRSCLSLLCSAVSSERKQKGQCDVLHFVIFVKARKWRTKWKIKLCWSVLKTGIFKKTFFARTRSFLSPVSFWDWKLQNHSILCWQENHL